jgi:hypothetical protein
MKQRLLSALRAQMLFVSTKAVSVFLPGGWEFFDRKMVGGVL